MRLRGPLFLSLLLHGLVALVLLLREPSPAPKQQEPIVIAIHTVSKPISRVQPVQPVQPEIQPAIQPAFQPAAMNRADVPRPVPAKIEPAKQPTTGGVASNAVDSATAGTGPAVEGRASIDLDLHPSAPDPPSGPQVGLPTPQRSGRARGSGAKRALEPSGGGTYTYDDKTFEARIDHDGTVTFEDHNVRGKGVGFSFDLTDAILRSMDEDPYRYEKDKFLEETRDLRIAMATRACDERLKASVLSLQDDLDAIWSSESTVRDKKRLLFQIWDDCAEQGSEAVLRHSEMARAIVLDYIKKKLPTDSAHAYSTREIADLNRIRRARRRFDPYTTKPRPDAGILPDSVETRPL